MIYSNFKIGDAVIRRWNNRLYYICHDIASDKWEFLIDPTRNQQVSKCKVAECYTNLRLATDSEKQLGYAEQF